MNNTCPYITSLFLHVDVAVRERRKQQLELIYEKKGVVINVVLQFNYGLFAFLLCFNQNCSLINTSFLFCVIVAQLDAHNTPDCGLGVFSLCLFWSSATLAEFSVFSRVRINTKTARVDSAGGFIAR